MTRLHPGHPTYRGEIHCCACLASAAHEDFDGSGCEVCDMFVALGVVTTPNGAALVMTSTRTTTAEPEFRAWLDDPIPHTEARGGPA